jgi:hypothetical protein
MPSLLDRGISLIKNIHRKDSFHRLGKSFLKAYAKEVLKIDADIRSNRGGDGIMGEVTLHGDNIYIQISGDGFYGSETRVLVRTCNGRKDYCGGQNWYSTIEKMSAGIDISPGFKLIPNQPIC